MADEPIQTLADAAKKHGLIKCSVRLSVARKPTAFNLTKGLDGTICTDGINKTQFVYPNVLKFKVGDELTVSAANVDINDG
ncbi:hypothetical protein niasHS_015139 [Heterodera schachtii]|uniref:Uncharacterized protein n=1 Tax=Heterodera schachtii TaxID=97005 RepID=A0ABD2I1B4_HETSC